MDNLSRHNLKHRLLRVAAISTVLLCSACTDSIIREGTTSTDSDKECRTERTTGSKLKRSICLSKEEWATLDARAEELAAQQERDSDTFFRRTYQKSGQGVGDGLDNPNTP